MSTPANDPETTSPAPEAPSPAHTSAKTSDEAPDEASDETPPETDQAAADEPRPDAEPADPGHTADGASPAWEPPRFSRDPEHRIAGGVAAGLAGATGIHVAAIRIAFVVGSLLHGAGVLLYAAAWLALPSLDDPGGRRRWSGLRTVCGAGLAAIALVVLLVPFADDLPGPAIVLPLVLIGIAISLWQPTPRLRVDLPSRSATDAPPAPRTPWPPAGRPAPIAPPIPDRPPSVVGRLTFGAALLALGLALALAQAGMVTLTPARAAALALVVVGLGLLAGAVTGRARWLVVLLLPLVPVALFLGTAERMGIDPFGPIGSRWYVPRTAADLQPVYRLGTGSILLDLSQVDPPGDERTITIVNGLGDVTVAVPEDASVSVDGEAALGHVAILSRNGESGVDRRVSVIEGPANPRTRLRLHLRTVVGSVVVFRGSTGPVPEPPLGPPAGPA